MRHVRLLLASPLTAIQREAGRTVVFPGGAPDPDGAPTRITIEEKDGVVASVSLDRSPYAGDQLYYAVVDGQLVVSDLFPAVLDQVPPGDRQVAEDGLVDHMLFRTAPGTSTLVDPVARLGHGETVTWLPGHAPTVERRPVRAPEPETDPGKIVDRLDRSLEASIAPDSRTGTANLFSGGVDSTLLQSYLGASVDTVNVAIDSPEFSPEAEYARRAEGLTGARAIQLDYAEQDYPDLLVKTIQDLGLPPHHVQTVSIGIGFSSGHRAYHTAQFADALFGLGFAGHAHAVWKLRAAARLGPLATLLPPPLTGRFRTLCRSVGMLRRPASHPESFAQSFAVYSDLDQTRRIFGHDAVRERIERRSRYARELLDRDADLSGDGLAPNLALGHWIDLLCDDTVALWKQLALARGTFLYAPFTHPAVIQASLAIEPRHRFVFRGATKYWLKTLLQRRMPDYPVRQPKYSSEMPVWRFFEQGPLRNALLDFERPDFLDPQSWRDLSQRPSWNTWNVLTFLIWDREVRRRRSWSGPSTLSRGLRYPQTVLDPENR